MRCESELPLSEFDSPDSIFCKSCTEEVVEIIKTARKNNIDLIIMGSHGRTGLPHVLIGSVAERVARKAHCPVLIVKDKNTKFEMP